METTSETLAELLRELRQNKKPYDTLAFRLSRAVDPITRQERPRLDGLRDVGSSG